jgi:hypothetical protein
MNRNRLAYTRGYLCGAMDRVQDGGIGWRKDIQRVFKNYKIQWMDPSNKPIDIGIEDLENRAYRRKCKEAGRYDMVQTDMKIIRCVDLRMVDISDFIVVNLDTSVHACGTYEELTWANRGKKPIIIRVEQGKSDCPDWILGTIPHEMIFSTWAEVYSYLKHVARDDYFETFRRWCFFDFHGEKECST